MRMVGVAALVAAGCSDNSVGHYNTAPGVTIVSPIDGQSFAPGEAIELMGQAIDDHDAPEDLLITWSSTLGGQLGGFAPDADGTVYLTVSELSPGDHGITLQAVDVDGASAQESITVTVDYSGEGEGMPTVTLIGPAEGDRFVQDTEVAFVGTVTDDEQPWDTLTASLISTRDGLFWSGNPESSGAVSIPWTELSPGTHTVTLSAEDDEGNVASDQVDLEILEDGRPQATIVAPASGDTFWVGETVTLEGMVSDVETDVEQLVLSWDSDVDGALGNGKPDSSGYAALGTTLSVGLHLLTLTVFDGDGQEGTDSVTVESVDPMAHDGDGDGLSEVDGDCDDDDPTVYPKAPELCDDQDNDCDGSVDEHAWDVYEPNDATDATYDLGEIDEDVFGGEVVTLSGLTLHGSADVDVFEWFGDDEWYDNVNVDVEVALPASGQYVLELYLDEGGGYQLKDSDSGNGTLRVSFDGDIFLYDEDYFMIVLYPTTWDAAVCEGVYDVVITG